MATDALDMETLVEAAAAATGLEDFGSDDWREGLARLVVGLDEEARLNELGVQIAAGEIVSLLSTRLELIGWRRDHPEIARSDIVPPIVIVGQGRTGTTILFDILAQDPASRVPLTWEVDRPMPPPEYRDLRDRSAHRRGRRAARRHRPPHPRIPDDPPDGCAVESGVRAA